MDCLANILALSNGLASSRVVLIINGDSVTCSMLENLRNQPRKHMAMTSEMASHMSSGGEGGAG